MKLGRSFLLIAVVLAGCTSAVPPPPAQVVGKVSVNGEPAKGLYVVFTPIGAASPRNVVGARTHKNGAFEALAIEPGEYVVTVFWPKVTKEDGVTEEGEDRFHGRFPDPDRPLTKTTISAGDNSLPPLDLKYDLGGQ